MWPERLETLRGPELRALMAELDQRAHLARAIQTARAQGAGPAAPPSRRAPAGMTVEDFQARQGG